MAKASGGDQGARGYMGGSGGGLSRGRGVRYPGAPLKKVKPTGWQQRAYNRRVQAERNANSEMVTKVARGGSIKQAPSAAEAARAAKQHIVDLQRANNNTKTFSPSLGSREMAYIKANEKKIAQLEKLVKKWSK